jgi:hypothetical protein
MSLCHRCMHKRDVKAARSWFLLCLKAQTKYVPQPVRTCPLFEPKPLGEKP